MSKKHSLDELFNDLTFQLHYDRLKLLALNMFVWEGLPNGMLPEYIEKTLYSHGKAIFFKHENGAYYCLTANPSEGVNIYGEHRKWYAFGFNYNKLFDLDHCVIIRNNTMMTNNHDYIMYYANKLTEIERTMDINIKAQKTPRIIACDDKDLLTFKAIFKKVDGNEPAIYADKNMNLNSLEVLDITAPYVTDKLTDYRHDVTNEALTFVSINNSNTDKKERLITDEVNSNNSYVDCNVELMLSTRQRACQQINDMWGLSMSVKRRIEEVKTSATIHPGTKRNIKK